MNWFLYIKKTTMIVYCNCTNHMVMHTTNYRLGKENWLLSTLFLKRINVNSFKDFFNKEVIQIHSHALYIGPY